MSIDKTNQLTFNQQCYELLKQIPEGKVSTYKEIALALNCKAYRAVGNAMNKNPNPVSVPCHRIVSSSGELGGYALGSEKKIALLKKEKVQVKNNKVINFQEKLFNSFKTDLF